MPWGCPMADDVGMDTNEGTATMTLTNAELRDRIRPANFNPADVQVVGALDTRAPAFDAAALFGLPADMYDMVIAEYAELRAAWIARNVELFGREYPGSSCEHCGAHIRWAAIVRYLPTGQHFIVGETCADERMSLTNRHDHDMRMLRMSIEARSEKMRLLSARAHFARNFPAEAAYLFDDARPYNNFIDDLRSKLLRYGSLSDKQVACITRNITRDADRAAKQAERAANSGPAPTGRVEVTGTIVSVKWVENDFGGTLKMVTRFENGSAAWVTAPAKLVNPKVGDVVTYTATFTPADDDPSFAFGKRPTGATYISQVVTT